MTPIALAGGSWIFLAFLVLFLGVIIYSYFTRTGSGIDETPYGDIDGSLRPRASQRPRARPLGEPEHVVARDRDPTLKH